MFLFRQRACGPRFFTVEVRPLPVSLVIIKSGQGGMGGGIVRLLVQGAQEPALAKVLVAKLQEQLAQLAVQGGVVGLLGHFPIANFRDPFLAFLDQFRACGLFFGQAALALLVKDLEQALVGFVIVRHGVHGALEPRFGIGQVAIEAG